MLINKMFLPSNKALIRVGEGVKEKPPELMSDGCDGRVMVPREAYRELVGQSKQRMVPGFEFLPT